MYSYALLSKGSGMRGRGRLGEEKRSELGRVRQESVRAFSLSTTMMVKYLQSRDAHAH